MSKDDNKVSKFQRQQLLDKLFRNSGGYTYDELITRLGIELNVDYISKRTILYDIKEFEKMGAVFDKGDTLKSKLRYKDPAFTIFPAAYQDIDLIEKAISRLQNTVDFRYENLVRLFLLQLRYGIEYVDMHIMSIEHSLDQKGVEKMEQLANAIVHKYPVKLTYKPFNKESFESNVHPYHLKQYNNRWTLLGWSEEKGKIYNYPIDRIKDITLLNKEYRDTEIDFNEYFNEIIGTTNPKDEAIQDILLKIDKDSFPYIRTKKLHFSQEHLLHLDTPEHSFIKLKVKINKELVMKLFSYGDSIEVVEPLALREIMKEKIVKMKKKYEV